MKNEKFVPRELKGVKIAYPGIVAKKSKPPRTAKIPRQWFMERPAISALNKQEITDSEFVLLVRIENLCYYDREGHLHPFYGSNRYLAKVSGCSVRSIQTRLSSLTDKGFLIVWRKERIKKNQLGEKSKHTMRYMCTVWTKNKIWNGRGKTP